MCVCVCVCVLGGGVTTNITVAFGISERKRGRPTSDVMIKKKDAKLSKRMGYFELLRASNK